MGSRTDSKVRDGVKRSFEVSKLRAQDSYLRFAGVLPINLPDGTRGVIYPDLHVPAHHRRMLWGVRNFVHDFKPHVNIYIGDLLDMLFLSRHGRPLRTPVRTQEEFDEGRRLIDDLSDASQAEHDFLIMGNHDDRFWRWLQEFAPQFGNIVTPDNREPLNIHNFLGYGPQDNKTFLYGVDERGGFEGGLVLNQDIYLHHGIIVKQFPGASALAASYKWQQSTGQGHVHRHGMAAVGDMRAYEFGHLVDMDHACMGYARRLWPNWHLGFAAFVVYNGKLHIRNIPIKPAFDDSRKMHKLTFIWDGKLYSESDR